MVDFEQRLHGTFAVARRYSLPILRGRNLTNPSPPQRRRHKFSWILDAAFDWLSLMLLLLLSALMLRHIRHNIAFCRWSFAVYSCLTLWLSASACTCDVPSYIATLMALIAIPLSITASSWMRDFSAGLVRNLSQEPKWCP